MSAASVVVVRRALAAAVVAVAGFALLAGVLVPRLAGATPYTVLSPSMEPRYPVGTLVVVRPTDDVRTGDVITYQLRSGEAHVVTHRVVAVGATTTGEPRYVTRGDANEAADREPVRPVQVRGEVWYHVPWLGRVSALMTGSQRHHAAIGVGAGLLAYAAWQAFQGLHERHARHDPHEPVVAGRTV
ncbi:signal peptidase I [Xylanimonas oleitrophica]|uniref:Signal peptidase I n=1 Tax=Xylanimonas oleitrophica TaxID=2607479 RepID=A0A2W5WR10_9MICO|nr:signal peptidase I [Xylanimonas oleitrophica]PZR53757.1 signal peptidase I [Xylanimonas oleitrophica]